MDYLTIGFYTALAVSLPCLFGWSVSFLNYAHFRITQAEDVLLKLDEKIQAMQAAIKSPSGYGGLLIDLANLDAAQQRQASALQSVQQKHDQLQSQLNVVVHSNTVIAED